MKSRIMTLGIQFKVFVLCLFISVACSKNDSVELPDLQVPSAFSPNGDQINDTWAIGNVNNYRNVKVTIRSQSLGVVYYSAAYANDWNGRSNQSNTDTLPTGVYFYTIEIDGYRTVSGEVFLNALSIETDGIFGLQAEDIRNALERHNSARSAVGVAPLVWSQELSADALSWARGLAQLEPLSSTNALARNQGQNMFSTSQSDLESPLHYASEQWYDGINDFTYGPWDTRNVNAATYAQMIWEDTQEVGMGYAISQGGQIYIVARYSPIGCNAGEYPY
ncbi:MAG: gliding motility-associated C-terminal domain-containing protein [Flavobacteriaceae bacterium]